MIRVNTRDHDESTDHSSLPSYHGLVDFLRTNAKNIADIAANTVGSNGLIHKVFQTVAEMAARVETAARQDGTPATQDDQDQELEEDMDKDIAPRLPSADSATQTDFINLTSLLAHQTAVARSKADVTLFAEHGIETSKVASTQRQWREKYEGYLHVTPLSKEAKGESAGVGMAAKPSQRVVFIKPMTQPMQEVVDEGRAASYCVDLGGGSTTVIHCIYGWTGSAVCKHTAARTDDVICGIRHEIEALGTKGPHCIIGDGISEPCHLPTATLMLRDEGWTDVGAQASRWGGHDAEPTCKANWDSTPTRRDILLCNSLAANGLIDFKVQWDNEYSIHAKLSMVIQKGESVEHETRNHSTNYFHELWV